MNSFSEFSSDIALVNSYLETEAFRGLECSKVLDAMKYSVQNGGKRIRPIMCLYFSDLLGGDRNIALKFGCALEMVHTYSLIHDDLPCMDNDDMRRGKPSCHIAFGEANALLAGDALLTESFRVIASSGASPSAVSSAVKYLSEFAGMKGMVYGQVLDLDFEENTPTLENVKKMYSLKTCALLKCACVLGCLTAEKVSEDVISKACDYAEKTGLAFQIIDDILDITSDSKTLGKPVGSDDKNNKPTFVKLYGLEESKKLVKELTEDAISVLESFDGDSTKLILLTKQLAERNF